MKKIILALSVLALASACGSKKKVTTQPVKEKSEDPLTFEAFRLGCVMPPPVNPLDPGPPGTWGKGGIVSLNKQFCLTSVSKALSDRETQREVPIEPHFEKGLFIATSGTAPGSSVIMTINGVPVDMGIPGRKVVTDMQGVLSFYLVHQNYRDVVAVVWTCYDRNLHRVWCNDNDGVIPK